MYFFLGTIFAQENQSQKNKMCQDGVHKRQQGTPWNEGPSTKIALPSESALQSTLQHEASGPGNVEARGQRGRGINR